MNKQKHLNLEARILIETLLNEHHSFKSIARELGKDCTTISKEVKAHILSLIHISISCLNDHFVTDSDFSGRNLNYNTVSAHLRLRCR